jgi:hypothetical protein
MACSEVGFMGGIIIPVSWIEKFKDCEGFDNDSISKILNLLDNFNYDSEIYPLSIEEFKKIEKSKIEDEDEEDEDESDGSFDITKLFFAIKDKFNITPKEIWWSYSHGDGCEGLVNSYDGEYCIAFHESDRHFEDEHGNITITEKWKKLQEFLGKKIPVSYWAYFLE